MQDDVDSASRDDAATTAVSIDFSNGIAQCLMGLEELRRSTQQQQQQELEVEDLFGFLGDFQSLLPSLDQLGRWTDDRADSKSVEADMFRHVQTKAITTCYDILQLMMKFPEPVEEDHSGYNNNNSNNNQQDPQELLREYQGVVAQTTELLLVLLREGGTTSSASSSAITMDEVVRQYVAFQRQTLRARVKPTIAKLIHERKRGFDTHSIAAITTAVAATAAHVYTEEVDDDDDDDDDDEAAATLAATAFQKYHANALAVILGQAAALLHPLLAWKVHLPPHDAPCQDTVALALSRMCTNSIHVLDEQAQQLTKTISDWFWDDRPQVDHFLQTSAQSTTSLSSSKQDLGTLHGLVEEMALACLLMAQYQSLLNDDTDTNNNNNNNLMQREILPEWTLKYASLERYLAIQQWHTALQIAQPVQIVMGTHIYVPSVVEDAQYLSTRALERAASTQAYQAIGTVAHAIAHDVWSTDDGGVSQALWDERGCFMDDEQQQQQHGQSSLHDNESKNFTSALLNALDEDLGTTTKRSTGHAHTKSPPQSGSAGNPLSGNFLAALTLSGSAQQQPSMRLLQMHAKFCALNGIHAAAGACHSLVSYLQTLLPPTQEDGDGETPQQQQQQAVDDKATAMIQMAREELVRYASAYETRQQEKVLELIHEYGTVSNDGMPILSGHGLVLDHIATFLAQEDYEIDATIMQRLESDERLEAEFMAPLKAYLFLQQIAPRCEIHVLKCLAEQLIQRVVQIILQVLWEHHKRAVTDWGALLLAKQVRLLQEYLTTCWTPPSTTAATSDMLVFSSVGLWERLTQAMQIVQMEKPAEWLFYYSSSGSILTPHEVKQTMELRVDFHVDAIEAVTNQITKTACED